MKIRVFEDCDTIKGRVTVFASPRVVDMPQQEAKRLVESGVAEFVDLPPVENPDRSREIRESDRGIRRMTSTIKPSMIR